MSRTTFHILLLAALAGCSSGTLALPDGGPGTGEHEGGATQPDAGTGPEGGPVGGRQLTTLVASGPVDYLQVDATSATFAAVDDQTAYTRSILRTPLAGGALTRLASKLDSVSGIATNGAGVYWVDSYVPNAQPDASPFAEGVVMSVPLGGGTPTTLATGQGSPQAIAADGASIYWANAGGGCGSPPSCPGSVMTMPAAGGTPVQLAAGPYQPIVVTVDGTSVYWGTTDGRLLKVAKTGGTATQLAFYQTSIANIAVDATSVYWTTSSGDVMKTPVGGGESTPLLVGTSSIYGLAIDATSVYFTVNDYPGSFVQKVPLSGGPPETLWAGSDTPGAIQVDATSVYVSMYQGGLVKLTPK